MKRSPAGTRGRLFPFLRALLALPFLAVLATAQDVPRVQVFAGYSYLYFDGAALGLPNSKSLNGYTFSPAFNITHRFGVVAEISGQYSPTVNFRSLTFGGQALFPHGKMLFFVHGLFFDARSFVSIGTGDGNTSRAFIGGGGVDYPLSSHFSFRVLQVDYVRSMLFNKDQNNVRLSTGIVYNWKTIRHRGHKPQSQPAP
jgi:hypothetical protein